MEKAALKNVICQAIVDFLENPTLSGGISERKAEEIRGFIVKNIIQVDTDDLLLANINEVKVIFPELRQIIENKIADYEFEQKYKIK